MARKTDTSPREPADVNILARKDRRGDTRARLSEIVGALPPGARLPGVRELCADLSISLSTLNAALSDLEALGRIHRLHGSGIYVLPSSMRRHIVLLYDPRQTRSSAILSLWTVVMEQVVQYAQIRLHLARNASGSDTVGDAGPKIEPLLMREILDDKIHGVIGVGLDSETVAWIASRNLPLVVFDCQLPGASDEIGLAPLCPASLGPAPLGPIHEVALDFPRMRRSGVDALLDAGCRKIAVWDPDGSDNDGAGGETAWGEIAASLPRDHALQVGESARLPGMPARLPGAGAFERGFVTALRLSQRSRSAWPDGVFTHDETFCAGFLNGARDNGIVVGTDLALATVWPTGSVALLGWERRVIRVPWDRTALVRRLFDTAEGLLRGETFPPRQVFAPLPVRTTDDTSDFATVAADVLGGW